MDRRRSYPENCLLRLGDFLGQSTELGHVHKGNVWGLVDGEEVPSILALASLRVVDRSSQPSVGSNVSQRNGVENVDGLAAA
jgi:hypothetical protein